ncbi:MAG TPA: hypothetical protein VJH92_01025 [Candidatus Nanoarchaeia archaeon]|nr:hypothetical protein [Candidatus Nanoarchaeia archaeon]
MDIKRKLIVGAACLTLGYLGVEYVKSVGDYERGFRNAMARQQVPEENNFNIICPDTLDISKEFRKDYVDKNGYGVRIPREEEMEKAFEESEVPLVSITTANGDNLKNLSHLFYRTDEEWINFKLFNSELSHYRSDEKLPEGLEVSTYMYDFQMRQLLEDFPERKISVVRREGAHPFSLEYIPSVKDMKFNF